MVINLEKSEVAHFRESYVPKIWTKCELHIGNLDNMNKVQAADINK